MTKIIYKSDEVIEPPISNDSTIFLFSSIALLLLIILFSVFIASVILSKDKHKDDEYEVDNNIEYFPGETYEYSDNQRDEKYESDSIVNQMNDITHETDQYTPFKKNSDIYDEKMNSNDENKNHSSGTENEHEDTEITELLKKTNKEITSKTKKSYNKRSPLHVNRSSIKEVRTAVIKDRGDSHETCMIKCSRFINKNKKNH